MIGKTVSHYKILEKLGGGGMGVVYKALDTKLDRFVALKFLPPHLGQSEGEKQRFTHEAKAASALDHNNICTIYEIGETEDGQMFIAMACYDGESLKDRIERGPLQIEDAIDISIQIAQGLVKAHSKEIVHRDIKPANILLTEDGQVKIVDFGLAKLAGRTKLTQDGTTMGTIAYMSPEQAQGADVDRRTDIWALGALLYEMVTGQQPFKGDYEQAIVYSIMNEEPEPVTGVRTGVPMELERIVSKAMAKEPKERCQHIDEMMVDLQSLRKQHDSGSAKTKAHPTPKKSEKSKRHYLYAVAAAIIGILAIFAGFELFQTSRDAMDSIMVLPLQNFSGEPEQEYFVDGMTEALITELSKITGLRVISRTSSMRYKNSDKTPPEIASDLDVGAIVEGSVLRAGDRVRITAQLIDARADKHLWAENYDRDLGDILRLHSEVARAIANQVRIKLTPQDEARLGSAETVDPEVYQLYLKGRHFWSQFTEESLLKSVDYFEQAIARDPNYALAYTGLASAYSALSNDFVAPHETMPKVRQAAIKALDLDETLAEAHIALGLVKFFYERDWPTSEKEFQRAIELNPSSAEARAWFALYLTAMGRHEEAILEMEKAQKLDPLSLIVRMWGEWSMLNAGRYDGAIQQALATLDFEPDFVMSHADLGLAYALRGDSDKALEAADKIGQTDPRLLTPLILALRAQILALAGRRSEAETQLAEVLEIAKQRYICAYEVGMVYVTLGKYDQAFEQFDQALRDASDCLVFTKVDPRFEGLRDDPRYRELLKKAGFDH
ncbi:MAG: protein kinase [bacterium]